MVYLTPLIPRKLFSDIQEISLKNENKPLLLHGARGIGKTTALQTLGNHAETTIYFNLEETSDRALFNLHYSPEEQLKVLFFLRKKNPDCHHARILLDEIQALPDFALHVSRLFREAPRHFWAMTSSQCTRELEELKNPPDCPIYPLAVYPCSFHDFLLAMKDADALESYQEIPFPGYRHEKLLHYFHLYTLIGGMPEIVQQYSETRNLTGLSPLYEKILETHLHALAFSQGSFRCKDRILHVMQNVFPYAATRIKFNAFGNSSYGSREMGEAFRMIESSMLLKLVYPHTAVTPPALPHAGKLPRLQLLDTGMVNYFSGIQRPLFHTEDMNRIFHGQVARQVVGQEIIATEQNDGTRLQFWVRDKAQSCSEVDFLLSYKNMYIPVEVRSGEPGRLRSLHQFIDASPHPYAVRLYAEKLSIQQAQTIRGKKFYLLNLPYFLAGKIKEHLEGFIKFVSI